MRLVWKFPFNSEQIKEVLVFSEGGDRIGFGHITRDIGLIQYLREFGLNVEFLVRGENLKEIFFEGERFTKCNWLENFNFDRIDRNTLVFVDSYFVGIEFYKKIYERTGMLVIYDDFRRLDYGVGYILNSVAEKDFYGGYDKVLWGEDFIFLRKPFWNADLRKRDGSVKNLLITLGGNPPREFLIRIVEYISKKWYNINMKIVSDKIDGVNAEFTGFCSSNDMVKLMDWADVAISAGGQTLHELYRMKVPTYMMKLAENQEYNIRFYEKRGFVRVKDLEEVSNLFYGQ